MKQTRWLILGLCLLNSGCADDQSAAKSSRRNVYYQERQAQFSADLEWTKLSDTALPEVVEAYRLDRQCDGAAYTAAREKIAYFSRQHYSADDLMAQLISATYVHAAKSLTDLGEIAAQKHCAAVARKTLLDVISVYTGSNYVAIRQRAQVLLDDLRATRKPERKARTG
jgi:hypothetical protein